MSWERRSKNTSQERSGKIVPQKVALITLGCPKNEVDSEVLAGELVRGGIRLTERAEDADVILINTCGFIEDAKKESIEVILEALSLKGSDGRPEVYVWGCLSERYKGKIEKEIPEVDRYFGVEPYMELGRLFFGPSYRLNKRAYQNRIPSMVPHSAYLKISDGCDHKCTFCAIPMIKGPYRSRSIDSLLSEARSLASRGVKELILIAQDTTLYGSDLRDGSNLVRLLEKLVSVRSIQWIRIMYVHPAHITDQLIKIIREEENICKYLDMPLQHISDQLLKAMGRNRSRKAIERLVIKIRKRVQGVTLRTSFIVGFPGETDEMFQELVDFIRETEFERMGVFIYSPEEGTQAFLMESHVPREVAEERYRILMEVQQGISYKLNKALISRTLPVLIDGFDKDRNMYYGRSEGDGIEIDHTVWVKGKGRVGEIVPVRITENSYYDLIGTVAEN